MLLSQIWELPALATMMSCPMGLAFKPPFGCVVLLGWAPSLGLDSRETNRKPCLLAFLFARLPV